MTTRAKGRGETSPAEDEFLQQMHRGGELLAANKVIEAKAFLERAHQLQPRNEKAQNLLGLTYFKLGLFDRAAELYEMLVRDNPVDPTLRVNLGLVYLKTNALQRAAREFETATDLAPDHQKAHNYMGLTLAQMGEYGRAREHFLLSGSDAMAEKMTRAIAGEAYARAPTPAPTRARPTPAPVEPPAPAPRGASGGSAGEGDWGAQFGLDERASASPAPAPAPVEEEIRFAEDEGPSALAETDSTQAEPVDDLGPAEDISVADDEQGPDVTFEETSAALGGSQALPPPEPPVASPPEPPVAPPPAVDGMPPPVVPGPAMVLAELAPQVALEEGEAGNPFVLGSHGFSVRVEGELLTRLEGLIAWRGTLAFQPEVKRFRGRATDKPFGEGPSRMVRASGQGVLFIEPMAQRAFLAVDLGEESAYFRDECVFAFEEPVMFENGRVPSDIAPDLDLVHLRGQGRVLLSLGGPLRSVPVRQEAAVAVPLSHLVGWQGNLTPRIVPLLKSPSGETLRTAVELSGEGFALIALGVR
ncbi:tetratricopeptide repeat protein [Myxococcaceae bacterium JPH2]|nr:tetratricopeptide repeat protein [Myxococcaceae bacterium JPH2]